MALMRINNSVNLNGVSFRQNVEIDSDNLAEANPDVAAAKVGQLTTRTSTTVGTFTMTGGHGITTAAIVDVYWNVGAEVGTRYGVVIGTVSTNSVPFSGGSGDNLPTNLTAVTVMTRASEVFTFTGNNATGIILSSPVKGYVHFAEADGTTIIASKLLTVDSSGLNYTYIWYSGKGETSPVASGAVGKVLFSHGDSANINAMYAAALHN